MRPIDAPISRERSPVPVIPRTLAIDLALAAAFALAWWLIAMLLQPVGVFHILYDQTTVFLPAGNAIANPYSVTGFFNPPWAAVLLAPFSVLPLPLAALLQLALYFVLLTLIVRKFGGDRRALIITLTSFVAFNSAIELNVEWMVCIGLLVPKRYSLPFLLIKPQTALGYVFSFRWRDLVYALIVMLVVGLVALLLWSQALPDFLDQFTSGRPLYTGHNIAPMAVLGAPLSILVGIAAAVAASRKHDPAWSVMAGIFFAPYLALYGLLLHLALLSCRAPRVTAIISIVMWVMLGGMMGMHLLNALAR